MMNIYIVCILVCICCILIFNNIYFSKQINEINRTLEKIKGGNFNIRVRFYSSTKGIQNLGVNLNYIIDEFQRIAEKKQYLEESRKKMVANISHDLRTPLTSILGYLEALQKDSKLNDKEKKYFLDIVYSKSQKLYSLLEEFFRFSKIEAEDVLIKVEKINLTNMIQDVLVGFYQEFVNENIEPIIEIAEKDFFVWGDSKAIDRILSNLLINALRYGKDEKMIGIKVRGENSMVWVDIWNGGAGIAEKDIPYIFDRLYIGETSRNGKFHGSGLGLAIVKKLVERLKGEVLVNSILNEKTTFSFSLPLYK
ncbi:HAMP domain-containing histidine kinase [Clostridium estertheticum]|uniref:sensor histidine kinase n=1 Tax=Clostridium estertheticum TaxID=238834 RepID=UPI001C7DA5FC|nr:HAMP domain-containing sensor histidine kinase [Clostridium estertheticum]MBX4261958.1 HAMP domain-containing histidine kinase [Clostridium estertheticum]WLC68646.1 HAMP domain-containing histidine kinase [Clostridium estertheticum]